MTPFDALAGLFSDRGRERKAAPAWRGGFAARSHPVPGLLRRGARLPPPAGFALHRFWHGGRSPRDRPRRVPSALRGSRGHGGRLQAWGLPAPDFLPPRRLELERHDAQMASRFSASSSSAIRQPYRAKSPPTSTTTERLTSPTEFTASSGCVREAGKTASHQLDGAPARNPLRIRRSAADFFSESHW